MYRVCDRENKGLVSVGAFKETLEQLGIALTRGQVSRLCIMFDEDNEGSITLEEWRSTLEAYQVASEPHNRESAHTYEQLSLAKLVEVLRKRNIDFAEMYNACDLNDDCNVSVDEVGKFIEGLNSDLKQKEIYAVIQFLDIDKNKHIERNEFLR